MTASDRTRVLTQHGAQRGGRLLGHCCREAVADAPPVHDPLGQVAGRGELRRHVLIDDHDRTALGERLTARSQRLHRAGQVVQALQQEHRVGRSSASPRCAPAGAIRSRIAVSEASSVAIRSRIAVAEINDTRSELVGRSVLPTTAARRGSPICLSRTETHRPPLGLNPGGSCRAGQRVEPVAVRAAHPGRPAPASYRRTYFIRLRPRRRRPRRASSRSPRRTGREPRRGSRRCAGRAGALPRVVPGPWR